MSFIFLYALKKSVKHLFCFTFLLLLGCNNDSNSIRKQKELLNWVPDPPFICYAFPVQEGVSIAQAKEIILKARNQLNSCALQKFIDETQKQALLPKFNILCLEDEKAENAFCIAYDSTWVIVYAPSFIESLKFDSKGYKQKFVFLHELGHLIHKHKQSNPASEIEADDFAGQYMYVFGAYLPEAIAAIEEYRFINDETSTHPNKKSRIESVKKGWLYAKNEGFPRKPSTWFEDSLFMWSPLTFINGGKFLMGAKRNDIEAANDEKPAYPLEVESFRLGQFEVTQELWYAVMGYNPSSNKNCKKCPVESVSYREVVRFIDELNARTVKNFRLPFEKEWEYAAKYKLDDAAIQKLYSNLDSISWNVKNSKETEPVGQKKHNYNLAVFDMLGNVAEWCGEPYRKYPYTNNKNFNPIPGQWSQRGGGVYYSTKNWQWGYRITTRYKDDPFKKDKNVGFRLVLDIQ